MPDVQWSISLQTRPAACHIVTEVHSGQETSRAFPQPRRLRCGRHWVRRRLSRAEARRIGFTAVTQAGRTAGAAHFDAAAWQPPPDTDIPNDSLGAAIRRGLALVTHTADSLPAFATGKLNCSNCHLNGGRNVDAAPLAGSQARFPKYMDRTGAVIGLADRVNYCFTRSLAGNRLPVDSREMGDILAYLAWLSTGVPVGEGKKLPGAEGLRAMPAQLTGDKTRGAAVFTAKCAVCHGVDGQGNPAIPPGVPPLWGPKSFSVGASMARQGKAASFIWHNMPFGAARR